MGDVAIQKNGVKNKPLSNTHQAIETLKQMIVENRLPAGSSHLETELASQLGMSRTPVREATLILEAQGLLEIRPRKGVHITSLSADDMGEIYQIFTELEGLAAELAASRPHSEEALKPAKQAIADMDNALAEDRLEDWADADARFHNELIRLGGNSRIAHIVETYNNQVARVRSLTLYMRPKPVKSNQDHRDVIAAIEAGDAKLARKIHTSHRIHAGELLISILAKHKLRAV